MAIQYEFKVDTPVLLVRAWGEDESLEEVEEYGISVVKTALENNCHKILTDERDLVYKLSLSDTYELGSYYASKMTRNAYIAIVCSEDNFREAQFFENVSVNRGMQLQVFTDPEKARKWLDNLY